MKADAGAPDGSKGGAETSLTIVVVNYNHGHFLPRCLSAIEVQTQAPDEVLVIDDASTDGSVDVITSFASRLPAFRLIRRPVNKGVVAAMNDGLAEARGTHVLFAAADDWIEPDLVACSMSMIRRFPNAGLCSALTRLANEGGEITGPFRTHVPMWNAGYLAPERVEQLLIHDEGWFNGNTTIVRRAAALEVGGYRPELRALTDMFLNVTLALRHGACFVPRLLAVWRRMESGYAATLTANPAAMLETLEAALGFMRVSAHARFPPAYMARWAGRWRFWAARACLPLPFSSRREWLRLLVRPRRPVTSSAVARLAAVPGPGHVLAIMALFVLLRRADVIPVLMRRIHWVWLQSRLERTA